MKYLGEDLADRDVDPLGYWHRRQLDCPSLGKMARALLAIPATSVPSERAFSMGGLICRDKRASLNGETIEMLMRMQDWYKKLPSVVMYRRYKICWKCSAIHTDMYIQIHM